jgi:signal transduction histidine kinase
LEKAAALLREHRDDLPGFLTLDPRGRELPGFLETLAGHLEKERATLLGELASLRANVDHVREIVAMQQSYAKVSGVVERVALADVVEDALQLNAGLMARRDLTLTRDYQARPVVAIDKHKALSILVNLIRNAVAACDESGRSGDKRITLRIATSERSATVAVVDNGVGIARENLSRIFSPGFTTRKDARGFGLHSGAIAAKQLGGTLAVHSEGPGQGAVSTFCLPLAPEPAPGS